MKALMLWAAILCTGCDVPVQEEPAKKTVGTFTLIDKRINTKCEYKLYEGHKGYYHDSRTSKRCYKF